MRVAILIDQLSPGACPKFVGEQVKHLRSKGHSAEVVALMEGGLPENDHQFQEFLDGVTIRYLSEELRLLKRLNFKLPMFAFFSAYHLVSQFIVPNIINRHEYDVIVAHTSLACFTAHQLLKRRGIPYINCMWDPMAYIIPKVYGPKLPKVVVKPITKLALAVDKMQADNSLITLTSSKLHAEFIRTFANGDVDVLYPGCFPLDEIPNKRGDYILTIDRWDAGNKPHMLLDVWERLSKKVELRIAGFWWPDELRQSFIKMRDDKGLTDYVHLLGSVSEEELSQLYLNARALAFPIPVTINMVVMEAASHGCPVVMPEGIEIFDHDVEGFFAAEGNIDEYAEYLDRLIADERLAWEMGHAGWERTQELSWEQHGKKLEEVITNYVL